MYIKEKTLDDLLITVYKKFLIKTPTTPRYYVQATKGPNNEYVGVLLELSNPRSRLSRTEKKGTLFSCLGELLWYFSGTNDIDFIKYYINYYEREFPPSDKTVHGGYGPRIFGNAQNNQIKNVIEILREKAGSRQAVVQIFAASDVIGKHNDVPCTCTMQFFIRDELLHMFVNMRSNDVFKGLPHDMFAFTMIQEFVARMLGKELGVYKHSVASLHLYTENIEGMKAYCDEGYQSTKKPMPRMPSDNLQESIDELLLVEKKIRTGEIVDIESINIDDYWKDLMRILQIYKFIKTGSLEEINAVRDKIIHEDYLVYINRRAEREAERFEMNSLNSEQLSLLTSEKEVNEIDY